MVPNSRKNVGTLLLAKRGAIGSKLCDVLARLINRLRESTRS